MLRFYSLSFHRKRQPQTTSTLGTHLKRSEDHTLELKTRRTTLRTLLYSPEMKAFVRENRGILLPALKIIQQKYISNREIEPTVAAGGNLVVTPLSTGSFKGEKHNFAGLVEAKGKRFFIKFVHFLASKVPRKWKIGYEKWETMLRSMNYSINGYNVRVIKPHLFYAGDQEYFVVSEFYSSDEVVQGLDLKGQAKKNFNDALLALRMRASADPLCVNTFDLHELNAFLHLKTNTILLYDIELD